MAKNIPNLLVAIQNHDEKSALLITADGGSKGGKFRSLDIENHIGNFENLGYLIKDNVVDERMAYNYFSYDIEKAWCNEDVQQVVLISRKDDKSRTAVIDPLFGNFEYLATTYLSHEGQTCPDLSKQ